MLVLSRQRDETIMIGDAVEITIVDIRGDKVRLGINAPPQVAVHRKEVYDAIKAENRKAAETQGVELNALSSAIRPGRRAGLSPAGRINPTAPKTNENTNQPDQHAQRPSRNHNDARRKAST